MGIYDELSTLDEQPSTRIIKPKTPKTSGKKVGKSTDQSTDQSTNQSKKRANDPLDEIESLGPIVERPRAFYITAKIDRWLDEAVRKLQKQGLHKMDRSVLVNGLLHDSELYNSQSLTKIKKRFMAHLTNKMLKRADRSSD